MLTGDNQQTATEIARTCRLLTPEMSLHVLHSPLAQENKNPALAAAEVATLLRNALGTLNNFPGLVMGAGPRGRRPRRR